MKLRTNRTISLILALCMVFALSANAFAANIESSNGSGRTPVNLITTNGGLDGGDTAATKLSVTIPTALPIAMADNGDVTTATDCKIVNNSFGAVRIKEIEIESASDWNLTAFGDKSTLAETKVGSNLLGFQLRIGSMVAATDNSSTTAQTLLDAPTADCVMSGVGNTLKNKLSILYDAIVSPLASTVNNQAIANIVIVVEWDTVD